jgi:hypothetical protein
MLIYDHEGFLEVDAQEIKQLCRSTAPVTFSDAESDAYEIHVVLCNYLDNSTQRCSVAFHAKTLKRTLVFAVIGGDTRSLWQNGQEVLSQLGFQLEDVNLKLSPAMLEVVLRDIPGLATPGGARKQRQERARLLAELQSTHDKEPDSAAGKKAANKLRGQKRLDDRTLELRQFLEELLGPAEAAAADLRTLHDQVQELTERVAAAEALSEAERSQREISESITAAAEKRIQELETSLVEMDTISANALKQKRKIAQLQKRLKELSGVLESTEQEAASELAKQQQSSADCKAAHDRIAELDAELLKSATSLENAQAQLANEKAEKARLDECLKAAELRIEALDKELADSREQAGGHDDAVKATEDVRVQLADAQQALHEALGCNQELERDLAAAVEQGGSLANELTKIREEYDQECNLRKHLEKSAAQNEKRIRALKKSLVRAVEDAAERPAAGESSPETAAEAETLKAELQQQSARLNRERQSRKKLEAALHEAHEQIDSLAETIRQTEQAADRASSAEEALAVGNSKAMELEEQLKSVEEQLAREFATQSKLAKDLAEAEQQIAELTTAVTQSHAERKERRVHELAADTEPAVEPRVKSSRPLPHELRPAPKKGALFHPDWDLPGLPFASIKQITKAWESAFNVQISLEGYPSQYCMVYLVVLKLAEQKKLYLLCRLKKSKHTLVSVPANMPHDEVSLQKAIAEGLKFLKMSGFEMEEISVENIESTLGSYCLKA